MPRINGTEGRAATLISRHKRAFDDWMTASQAMDESSSKKDRDRLDQASEAFDTATAALVNYRPEKIGEVGEIAKHLSAHIALQHIDQDDFLKFLRSLSVAPDAAPDLGEMSEDEVEAINDISNAGSDIKALLMTLRENCLFALDSNKRSLNPSNVYDTLGVAFDNVTKIKEAVQILDRSRIEARP